MPPSRPQGDVAMPSLATPTITGGSAVEVERDAAKRAISVVDSLLRLADASMSASPSVDSLLRDALATATVIVGCTDGHASDVSDATPDRDSIALDPMGLVARATAGTIYDAVEEVGDVVEEQQRT